MSLDVATLTFAGGFVTFSSGLLVLVYWFQDRGAWAALWWAVAGLGSGVGIVLLALHGSAPFVISDIVGPWLLDICAVLTWIAARVFNRRAVNLVLVCVGVGLWITVLAVSGAHGGERYAIMLGTGISGCLYAAAALDFWRAREERLRARWLMISALTTFSIALFLTSVGVWVSAHVASLPPINRFGVVHFAGLAYAIVGAISLVMMLKERTEAAFKAAALIDPLTGLANRRSFMDRAQRVFDRHRVDGEPISLLALDLDRFKLINDTFGHPVGDQVLRIFAEGLSWTLRPADIAARIGGEEFVVLLPGCGIEAALVIADRIRAGFQGAGEFVNGQRVGATVSVGAVTSTSPTDGVMALHSLADAALYVAKSSGRNRVVRADGSTGPAPSNVLRIA
jgi:diguanylate cyclase (GGDEF)-like protein